MEKRARALDAAGIKPLDALHLASAEEVRADYLCTCDDGLLKRAKAVKGLNVKVVRLWQLYRRARATVCGYDAG